MYACALNVRAAKFSPLNSEPVSKCLAREAKRHRTVDNLATNSFQVTTINQGKEGKQLDIDVIKLGVSV